MKDDPGELKKDAEKKDSSNAHPSRHLSPRARGYGIGGGYERPYRRPLQPSRRQEETYGPVPHSGYYGAGAGSERFARGRAGFNKELSWYASQYGENTLGPTKERRKP